MPLRPIKKSSIKNNISQHKKTSENKSLFSNSIIGMIKYLYSIFAQFDPRVFLFSEKEKDKNIFLTFIVIRLNRNIKKFPFISF
jgi:hypothetical protein